VHVFERARYKMNPDRGYNPPDSTLADLGAIYLLILGVVAIAVMLKAPKGIWGLIADRYGWQMFPLQRRLVVKEN